MFGSQHVPGKLWETWRQGHDVDRQGLLRTPLQGRCTHCFLGRGSTCDRSLPPCQTDFHSRTRTDPVNSHRWITHRYTQSTLSGCLTFTFTFTFTFGTGAAQRWGRVKFGSMHIPDMTKGQGILLVAITNRKRVVKLTLPNSSGSMRCAPKMDCLINM